MDEQTLAPLRRISGVAAAYIVGPQGVLAGAVAERGAERLSQVQGNLLAAIVGALRQATTDLGVGELGETIMEAEQGAIVAGTLPDNRAVVVLAQDRSSLGMIRVELRRLRRGA
jgi:uncharacterized protein